MHEESYAQISVLPKRITGVIKIIKFAGAKLASFLLLTRWLSIMYLFMMTAGMSLTVWHHVVVHDDNDRCGGVHTMPYECNEFIQQIGSKCLCVIASLQFRKIP